MKLTTFAADLKLATVDDQLFLTLIQVIHYLNHQNILYLQSKICHSSSIKRYLNSSLLLYNEIDMKTYLRKLVLRIADPTSYTADINFNVKGVD
jgi:hypothetical protein